MPVEDWKSADDSSITISSTDVEIHRSRGDGSCWYHSASRVLPDTSAVHLRIEVAAWVARNPGYMISGAKLSDWIFWDAETDVRTYARKMYKEHAWGGGIENAALAQIYGCFVDVYICENDEYRRIARFRPNNTQAPLPVLSLVYQGSCHYDSMNILV